MATALPGQVRWIVVVDCAPPSALHFAAGSCYPPMVSGLDVKLARAHSSRTLPLSGFGAPRQITRRHSAGFLDILYNYPNQK